MFLSRNTKKEDAMDSLPQHGERNYLPHLYETRLHSCRRIRESNWPMRKVLSYYHVKRPSVYRWLRRFDELGEEGLRDRSYKLIRPRIPEHNGKVDEAVQLDPQDGARPEGAGPGRDCQTPGAGGYYGRGQVPQLIKCLTSSDS